MNLIQMANNVYKSGSHKPNYRTTMAVKDHLNTPTQAQAKYRNALYKFSAKKDLYKGYSYMAINKA